MGKNRNENIDKQCNYCHKLYHTADECRAKHDYPPWYKQKTDKTERIIGNTVAYKEGKREREGNN